MDSNPNVLHLQVGYKWLDPIYQPFSNFLGHPSSISASVNSPGHTCTRDRGNSYHHTFSDANDLSSPTDANAPLSLYIFSYTIIASTNWFLA